MRRKIKKASKDNKIKYSSKRDVSYVVIFRSKNKWNYEIVNSLSEAKNFLEKNALNMNGFIFRTSTIYNPIRD